MERSKIELFNMDCMEAMKDMPDNAFDLAGYELDTEYYEAAVKRLEQHRKQLQLF